MERNNCSSCLACYCAVTLLFVFIRSGSSFELTVHRPRTLIHRHQESSSSSLHQRTRQSSHHEEADDRRVLTSALIKVSFDGGRCTGWSSRNTNGTLPSSFPEKISRRRKPQNHNYTAGFVRSVQGLLQDCLSPLYGNLPVTVEGCSRTDKGVHARGLVAQFYCVDPLLHSSISDDQDGYSLANNTYNNSIPGKKLPHPWNATDTSVFKPLPTSLATIQSKLNRMLPYDVRVVDIAPLPSIDNNNNQRMVFHPALSSTSKTYEYTLSVGPIHDPTQWRNTWHIGDEPLDIDAMLESCTNVLTGSHDFQAFQGAPRGKDDKMKRIHQNTICSIFDISIERDVARSWLDTNVYVVTITGDRFLYKMVRFLVGALVAVGQHKLLVSDVERAVQSGSRDDAPEFLCAPAKALCLADIEYGGMDIDWLSQKNE